MSTLPSAPFAVPPLPPAWSEHLSPTGISYYYNVQTQESTYIRPIPTIPVKQFQGSGRKEKPVLKKHIPDTEWLCVITNLGNRFYFNGPKERSVWMVPDEIAEAVATMESKEKEDEERAQIELLAQTAEAEKLKQMEMEVDRIEQETKGVIKRKADEETPLDEIVVSKKTKLESDEESEDNEDKEEEEEEEWQRDAAAQLAIEAAEESRRQEEEKKWKEEDQRQKEETKSVQRVINMPTKVDLSIDEAKALFKTLLRERDINPLHPWDTSLPKFVSDPRYVLLPSVNARRDAFDEYCRDRARELRTNAAQKKKCPVDPGQDFKRLLEQEVKSTRTSWTDFRRAWKKDRRFYGWGRDDREREKRFREFLKDLGEKKRMAAQKAEADFFLLLKEHQNDIREGVLWKEAKRSLTQDPRYDAIGSSSLREELFKTFIKGSQRPLASRNTETMLSGPVVLSREERRERAMREREQKVKAELSRIEMSIERSRVGINQEEGERDYKSMLVDAIRDPQVTWEGVLPQLRKDPRFRNSPLPPDQQLLLFQSHVAHLRQKHMTNLHDLFQLHSSSVATSFSDLPLESLLKCLPVTKIGLDVHQLEDEYDNWQKEQTTAARVAFNEMLVENSFIEFWGRLNKIGGEGVDGGVKADEMEEDEGEGGGGTVDMKALAKKVDLTEMVKVLKNDKRYTMFDHAPKEREIWLREYVANLSAPKLSVHLS